MSKRNVPQAYANDPALKDAYERGYKRGDSCASWCDMPEIGDAIPRSVDWVGYRVVTDENQADVHTMYAHESESNNRQYSPFEFTAHEFNSSDDSEALWGAFQAGIDDGINDNISARYAAH